MTVLASGAREIEQITAWQRDAGFPSFCASTCYDYGVYLGCHRAGDHPEGARPGWHLDRTRGIWWQVTDGGVVVQHPADMGGAG